MVIGPCWCTVTGSWTVCFSTDATQNSQIGLPLETIQTALALGIIIPIALAQTQRICPGGPSTMHTMHQHLACKLAQQCNGSSFHHLQGCHSVLVFQLPPSLWPICHRAPQSWRTTSSRHLESLLLHALHNFHSWPWWVVNKLHIHVLFVTSMFYTFPTAIQKCWSIDGFCGATQLVPEKESLQAQWFFRVSVSASQHLNPSGREWYKI